MRTIAIILGSAAGLLLVWSIAAPQLSGPGISGVFTRAMSEAKQVGLAAKLYSDDHQGRLPETLQQLVPNYLPNDALLTRTQLTTPGVLLKDLPPTSILLVRTATDSKRKETRVVLVRGDISVDLEHR